jgi:hypothetical protein
MCGKTTERLMNKEIVTGAYGAGGLFLLLKQLIREIRDIQILRDAMNHSKVKEPVNLIGPSLFCTQEHKYQN